MGLLLMAVGACQQDPASVAATTSLSRNTSTALGPPSEAPVAIADDVEPPFRLGPGDAIEVELLDTANTRRVCQVLPDGRIYFDLLTGVRAAGLTLPELQTLLEKDLHQYYRNPQVGLTLRRVRSQRVWIMGRVNTPGIYPLDMPLTVLEGLARAGGLASSRFSGTTEELADLRHSFLVRDSKLMPVDFQKLLVDGDATQNVRLRNGDFVYLPSALSQEVYVLGAVNQPRSVGFRDRVTLISVIAAARGIRPNAYASNVLIIRGSLTHPEVFHANLLAVLAGAEPDVELQPRDIVWVADSPWTNLERYARMVVDTFVRTVAANEGANFAVPGAGYVPITNPVGPNN